MFDWDTYLDLAEKLAGEPDEASQRSAVSRAYYAAFCSARNKLEDENKFKPTGRGKDHEKVWNLFQTSTDKDRRRIGCFGNGLRIRRGKVDYENEVPDLAKFVADASKNARKLLSGLRSL